MGKVKHLLGLLEGDIQDLLCLGVGKDQQLVGLGHDTAHHGDFGLEFNH